MPKYKGYFIIQKQIGGNDMHFAGMVEWREIVSIAKRWALDNPDNTVCLYECDRNYLLWAMTRMCRPAGSYESVEQYNETRNNSIHKLMQESKYRRHFCSSCKL